MYLNNQYEKNWCKRFLKKDAKCIIKDFLGKPWPFDSKKSFALAKKCMVKTCNSTFVSLSDVSLKK
jgi:hypothetical protein